MGQFIVRGVPASVLHDSWWLDTPETPPERKDGASAHKRWAPGALVVLVALADALFLDHSVGVSLAVFTLVVAAVVWVLLNRRNGLAGPALLLIFSLLPVVEYVQALSIAFLLGGSVVALCWAVLGRRDGSSIRRFLAIFPVLAFWQAFDAARRAEAVIKTEKFGLRFLRGWGFPVGGALVLAGLMISANPVLSEWVDQFWRFEFRLERGLLWMGAAFLLWPILAVASHPDFLSPKSGPRRVRSFPSMGLNAQSVANALILFNLLLAVQTGMDAMFLWGNVSLPDGMTYAEYAHRGAYPLLATALLAGAFALAARPYLDEGRGLRTWMMLWLGQNVLLVVSSLLRLSLYVEAYGLTYLRIHAAIWMAVVAAGLCLTGWQILRDRSNLWLLTRAAGLALAVLYACCFINFAALIAHENLRHPDRYDAYYVCQLGPMAAAQLATHPRGVRCEVSAPQIGNWREWGFRADRVIRNLHEDIGQEAGHEDSRR